MASGAEHAGVNVSDETLSQFRDLLSAHSEEIAAAYADAGYDEDKVDWKQIEDHLKESWQELAQGVVVNNIPKALDPLNPTDEERDAIRDAMIVDNPYLVPWLEKHGADLVTEIVEETKLGLRSMLVDAHEQGDTVDEVRAKVKERVGLLDRDYAAVITWEQELIDDGMDEADAADEAAIYADELLERRADNIARTEINFAESNGTLATWLTAADSGMTLPGTGKVWIAGTDESRTCVPCQALAKKYGNDPIPLDAEFELPDGTMIPCPPAHPSCRCDMGMVTTLGKASDKQQERAMANGTGVVKWTQLSQYMRPQIDSVKVALDEAIDDLNLSRETTIYEEASDFLAMAAERISAAGRSLEKETSDYKAEVERGDWKDQVEKTADKQQERAMPEATKVAKSIPSTLTCKIQKFNDEQQIVFGWLSVAKDEHGNAIVDLQGDEIPIEVLEPAAYEFVLDFRKMGDCHDGTEGRGRLVESVVMTKQKQDAMGIPPGVVPEGWWVGFKVDDARTWGKVKRGEYEMMSIGGEGLVEESE